MHAPVAIMFMTLSKMVFYNSAGTVSMPSKISANNMCCYTGQGGTPLWHSSAMFHQSPSLCLNMARTFIRATVLSYQSL